jgi:hypothetical protein
MRIEVQYLPVDLMQSLTEANATQCAKCFENCMIAVLGLADFRKLEYVLGLMTPPGYDPVVHAWLAHETQSAIIYFDPTLQVSSALWRARKDEFIYVARHSFTRQQLLKWLRTKYTDREFDGIGMPDGPIKGPILNAFGELE